VSSDKDGVAEQIRGLSRWAAHQRLEAIPDAILARAARVLSDDLAAIVGARDEPEVKSFHDRIARMVRPEEATVFRGGRVRTDRLSAAVANAVAANWLELDEGYRTVPCHAGLYVVPALMAEAEIRNLRVDHMLRALVLGYEMVTRIARSWTPKALVMQSHGRYAAVGAAAAVALSRGLNEEMLSAAISTAVTLIGPSPRTHLAEGVLARNVWPASGAWAGSMAVEWTECGIYGSPAAFFDTYSTVLGGQAHPERLTEGLGDRYSIEDGYTKIYACCQHLHSAVEATLDLRPRLLAARTLNQIAAIRVETYPMAMVLMNPRPETTLGAKFSMSHAVAAAIATGTGGADAFSASTLDDPEIARLRDKVSVAGRDQELPPPHDRPARVVVELIDGTRIDAECLSAVGGPDRPLPAEVVFEKVAALASPVYPAMLPVLQSIARLDPAVLRAGWRDLVDTMCSQEQECH
jgi:2-methylcitrate dehydratase PrpD